MHKTAYQMLKTYYYNTKVAYKKKHTDVCTIALYLMDEFVQSLFYELMSLIAQQKILGKRFLPGFWRPGK